MTENRRVFEKCVIVDQIALSISIALPTTYANETWPSRGAMMFKTGTDQLTNKKSLTRNKRRLHDIMADYSSQGLKVLGMPVERV